MLCMIYGMYMSSWRHSIVVKRFNVVETISNLLLVSFQYIFYILHGVTKYHGNGEVINISIH